MFFHLTFPKTNSDESADIHLTQTFLSDSDYCVCLEMEELDSHIVPSTNPTDLSVIPMVVCVLA